MPKDNLIRQAIAATGSFRNAAKACGVSVNAVTRWAQLGRLPWTDLVGFTNYAYKLHMATDGLVSDAALLFATRESLLAEHKARVKREKRQVRK